MKNIIYALIVALLLGSCLSQERKDGRFGTSLLRSLDLKLKTVFPVSPVITKNGKIKLTCVVTDGNGNYLSSTPANPIGLHFDVKDPSILRVDEYGNVRGLEVGNTTVSVYATKGQYRSNIYDIQVFVVNQNIPDVAEIYLSQNGAYIDLGAKRKFRLTAVSYNGAQTSLSEGRVEFMLSNDNVSLDKKEIALSTGSNPIEIELTGLSKGYTFVTPVYYMTKDAETVKITGTPLVVQVKDPVQSSKPDDERSDGGHFLSMSIQEDDGKKLVHVGHYDETFKSFKTSYFDATWYNDPMASPASQGYGKQAKLVLSPFSTNKNRPLVLMLQDKKAILWYQIYPNTGWLSADISSKEIESAEHPFKENKRYMDITTDNEFVYIAYFDNINKQVCVQKRSTPKQADFNACHRTENNVTELSIAANPASHEPRVAYIDHKKQITYLTVQGGKFFTEKISHTTGDEESVRIKLNSFNKVSILSYKIVESKAQIDLITREPSGDWAFQNIPLEPVAKEASGIDFAFDAYNEPRVVFSADQKVRYARRTFFANGAYKWLVDTPAQAGEDGQGSSSAIFVDSSNIAHIVYANSKTKWFNYWVEPSFFDYRDFPASKDIGADVIRTKTK